MDLYAVTHSTSSIPATIDIPGSKSYTNRALILAALTHEPVTLHNPLYSEDTEALLACLKTLGLTVKTSSNQIIVFDSILKIKDEKYELFARDSGTTLRFLVALLCITPGVKVISGSAQLNQRPIKDLVDALRQLGAKIEYLEKEGYSPLRIDSSRLHSAKEITINASLSSQYVSALLMISPLLDGLKIRFDNKPISQPYIDMTLGSMRDWGINVLKSEDGSYTIPPGQHYKKNHYHIEGDYSSAGYFFGIAALNQTTLTLKNLNPLSEQADRNFLNILTQMGNTYEVEDNNIVFTGKQIIPLDIDMENCPDQVQTLAVLAAFAKGITTITGVRSLRLKETERVKALRNELAKMGIRTEDTHDTLTIYGGDPQAAIIDTYGDHRMAMAFAVAGTKLPGIIIRNPEVVNKTFPSFWEKLKECP